MADPLQLGVVEPQAAIAAFEKRGLLQPSFRWQEVWGPEHTRAFAVAGVSRLDVLQIFKDEIEAAVRDGHSLADFRQAIVPRLTAKGFWGDVEVTDPVTGERRISRFDNRRLGLIFDVNLRQSYAEGSWTAMWRNRARQPFGTYITMRDEHVRATHRAWDGVTLPLEHPWWETHTPPCGWRCRCRVKAGAQKDIDRRIAAGLPVKLQAPPEQLITYVNPLTGEIQPVPRGVDPGFGYRKGLAGERDAELHDTMLRKALASYPLSAATAVAQAQADHPAFVAAATRRFGRFVDDVMDAKQPSGQVRFIGALMPGAVRAIGGQGVHLTSAVVAVRDVDVLHALRDSKLAKPSAIAPSIYRRLPELLARAQAVLLEEGSTPPALLYVVDLVGEDGRVAKLVVQLDAAVKLPVEGARRVVNMNLVRTATVMDANALQDRARYRLIWGRL